jgi:prepilin-type N-terminal cleavage/methylation domain-containing protein
MNRKNEAGFTLYELLVTVLIIGVVLSLGLPNVSQYGQNSRLTSTANDLLGSFHLARRAAARAKTNITICASDDSMTATPGCGGEFEDGWIVFVDNNGDIAVDDDEAILRRYEATPDGINIDTSGMGDYFSFAASGLGRGNVTGVPPVTTAILCDTRRTITAAGRSSAARVLVIEPLGRATVLRGKDQVDFHGGC